MRPLRMSPGSPHDSPRPTKGSDFERECSELFAEVVHLFGVPKSLGSIYGTLFASSVPLSFSEIVERLDISKGSASQGLQLLRSLGAIRLTEVPESADRRPEPNRREYFEPELGLRLLVSGVIRERVAPVAASQASRLARLREVAASDTANMEFNLKRVKQLETWRRRVNAVLPVLSVLLGPKPKWRSGRGEAARRSTYD